MPACGFFERRACSAFQKAVNLPVQYCLQRLQNGLTNMYVLWNICHRRATMNWWPNWNGWKR